MIECSENITQCIAGRKLTSMGVGGRIELLARPTSHMELISLLSMTAASGTTVRILGSGTNIVLSEKGISGLVIQLSSRCFRRAEWDGGRIRARSGIALAQLVLEAASRGFSGLEPLAGIPGTLGGALAMNSGGRHGCIGDVVSSVLALGRSGHPTTLSREDCRFTYRNSHLKGMVVLDVTLVLEKADPPEVRRRTRAILREKYDAQPLSGRSAGCVFKNPPGLSAGRLLDELGFRGRRKGGAKVSRKHANFILNSGDATARDVVGLMAEMEREALEKRGVVLEREVEVWE